MAIRKKTEIVLDAQLDKKNCRHYLNGQLMVLHCHHYMSLYAQLAKECGMLDGKKLLSEVAEDTFFPILSEYYRQHQIDSVEDRFAIGAQYYAVMGLGQMQVECAGPEMGDVVLSHSHVDEGWLKKWGENKEPINYVTCGYIAALFASTFDKTPRAFIVSETAGIVQGAVESRFSVVAN